MGPPRRESAPPAVAIGDEFATRQDAAAKVLQKAAKSPEAKDRRRRTLPPSGTGGFPERPSNSAGASRSVRMTVGVRVRPMSSKELKRGSHSCLVTKEGKHVFAHDPDDKMGGLDYLRLDKTKDKAYQFDHAFSPEETTEHVYDLTVKRVISAVMDGFHGSCFAYGATGSGKTYTMTGDAEQPGIMPRAISDLFAASTSTKDDYKWRFSLTYVEIYNERVKDLLNPMCDQQPLSLAV